MANQKQQQSEAPPILVERQNVRNTEEISHILEGQHYTLYNNKNHRQWLRDQ